MQSITPFALDTLPVFPRLGIYMLHKSAEVHDIDISATDKSAMLTHLCGETSKSANATAVIENVTFIIGRSLSFIARNIARHTNGINERAVEMPE